LVVDQKILTRAIAVLVLAIAMVAAAARFGGMDDGDLVARDMRTERRADPLAAELERCRTLGLEAANDADCAAAWAENRERFFSADGSPREDLLPKRQDRIRQTILPEPVTPSAVGVEAR
jgi:conjugative transfer region protein TrbK